MTSRPVDLSRLRLEADTMVADRFQVKEAVGQSGVSIVYRVMDRADGHDVALKLLSAELAADLDLLLRLKRELATVAEIFHPRLVNIRNHGEWNGMVYVAMEFIDGKLLKADVEERGAVSRGQLIRMVYDIGLALEALEREGIPHLAVWPMGVLVERNLDVKLMDFLGPRARRILGRETEVAWPHYLAPEQADPKLRGDQRTDVYSLGAMLYELMSGRSPFSPDVGPELLAKHRRPDPRPLREIVPDCPDWIQELTERALRQAPGERFQSVHEFVDALRATAAEVKIEQDVEAVLRDVERKREAREARERSFVENPLPPLVLPTKERPKGHVRKRDFTPAEQARRRKTALYLCLFSVGAILLSILLAKLTSPKRSDLARQAPDGQVQMSGAERAKLAIDGFGDDFPGDDDGYYRDLVALGEKALPTIRARLSDRNPVVRRYLAEALGDLDPNGSRRDLEKLAGDRNSGVREAALLALDKVSAGVSADVLEKALAGGPREAELALKIVAGGATKVDASAIVPLVRADSPLLRARAARALGHIDSRRAPRLLAGLVRDQNALVRREAASAFRAFASKETAGILLPLLDDRGPGVAAAAARSLAVSLSPIMRKRLALKAAEAMGDVKSPHLVMALLLAGESSVREDLLARLDDPDPALRAYSARVLRLANDRDAVKAIRKSLIARKTCYAEEPLLISLAALGDRAATQRVIAALHAKRRSRLMLALRILREARTRIAVDDLRALTMGSAEPPVRAAAQGALAAMEIFPKQIEDLFVYDNPDGQRKATYLFSLAGDASRVPRIREIRAEQLARSGSWLFDVALARLGERVTIDGYLRFAESKLPVNREAACKLFAESEMQSACPVIARLLKDTHPGVLAAACRAAAAIGCPAALPEVKTLLAHEDPAIAREAAVAAYRLGDEQIVGEVAALPRSKDPKKRAEICRTLGAMGSPLAVPFLVPLLDDMAEIGRAIHRPASRTGPSKAEVIPRVRDEAVKAIEAITGKPSGYDRFSLDEERETALQRFRASLQTHMDEILLSEHL